MNRTRILGGVLGLHLAVALVHGSAHGLVPVSQPLWQNVLVLATVFVGPIAGVLLAWDDHPLGVPLFTMTMAAGLVLGGTLHFLVENPDHVESVPTNQWRPLFQASAAGLAITGPIGTVVGAVAWYEQLFDNEDAG
jgi:ABC-type xylose transport system permease subunit